MDSLPIIRFDQGPVDFVPEDFYLTPPKIYKTASYKPVTSQLKYKSGPCAILFPPQQGYGLSELKNEKGELLNYSTPYYKKDETDEEKIFNKWIEQFEKWIEKTVLQYAEEEIEKAKMKQAVEIIQKEAEKIKKETIKPFFVYPKDEATGMINEEKLLRHYLKFRVDTSNNLIADVFNYQEEELNPSAVIITKKGQDDSLRKGEYLFCAKIKGVFYGAHGKSDYVVSIQTEGQSICYKKLAKTTAHALLGNRSEKGKRSMTSSTSTLSMNGDEENGMEDDDVQAAMRKKLEERVKNVTLE